MKEVLALFENWVRRSRDHYAVLRDVHGVMLARKNGDLLKAHCQADLVLADGMPLVWITKFAGISGASRVSGPDLLLAVCEYGIQRRWRHFFYGGEPGVAELVVKRLRTRLPELEIAGVYSPPFRSLTNGEDQAECDIIRQGKPNFVWVGLGTPKQELWMLRHRGKCGGAVLLGIGAAFNIAAGLTSRAPKFIQKSGLEWAFRLAQEPRRLWPRYLNLAPRFVFLAILQLLKGSLYSNRRREGTRGFF